jgi:hypothetical protein
MDLWSPGGLHLESVGEGKLHAFLIIKLWCPLFETTKMCSVRFFGYKVCTVRFFE